MAGWEKRWEKQVAAEGVIRKYWDPVLQRDALERGCAVDTRENTGS